MHLVPARLHSSGQRSAPARVPARSFGQCQGSGLRFTVRIKNHHVSGVGCYLFSSLSATPLVAALCMGKSLPLQKARASVVDGRHKRAARSMYADCVRWHVSVLHIFVARSVVCRNCLLRMPRAHQPNLPGLLGGLWSTHSHNPFSPLPSKCT